MKRFHFRRLFWVGISLMSILLMTWRLVLATSPPMKVRKVSSSQKTVKQVVSPHASMIVRSAPSWVPKTLTLLDEGGHLVHPIPASQITQWQKSLRARHLKAERRSNLHLWLGEWELAHNQQPEKAISHFQMAQKYSRRSDDIYGISAYNTALTLLQDGAYAKATPAFKRLMLPKTALKGYNRRTCALWYRHSRACEGYHAANARLGIPEPPKLDPLCGPAALAECLRAHGLPSDKPTLLRSCRMTGFGSTLEDLARAAVKNGLSAYPVTADDAGLRALPKPLVAHIEGDHFVVLVRADEHGISYLCSDCGAWPGGRIDLTWAQWHAMNPGVYLAAVPKHSVEDNALSQLAFAAPEVMSGLQFASAGRIRHLSPQVLAAQRTLLTLLKAHVIAFINIGNFYCGYRPDTAHCTSAIACPEDGPGPMPSPGPASPPGPGDDNGPSGGPPPGPSCGDPVNLATGEEEYKPRRDLFVYNPGGPSVSWNRLYNSLRSHGNYYESDDYGIGWSHNYNVRLYVSGQQVHLVMPNGSQYVFAAAFVPGPSAMHVDCFCTTPGVPIMVGWDYVNGAYNFTVLHSDRTKWIFADQAKSLDLPPCYSLAQIINRTGQGISFIYKGYGPASAANSAGFPLLAAIIDDKQQPLLTIARSRDGKANITAITDRYGRSIYYQCQKFNNANVPAGYPQVQQELISVSQVVSTGTFKPPFHYKYGYQSVGTGEGNEQVAGLHTITIPSPTGQGESTATLNYDSSGIFIDNITDANGNVRSYKPIDALHTQVVIKDSMGNVTYSYTAGFDQQMRTTTQSVGANNVQTFTVHYSDANMVRPDSITDGNNKTTQYQWDQFGSLQTKTSSRGTTTIYRRDYSSFVLGELKQVQEITANGVHKTPTSFTYHEPSGLIKSVSTPLPGSTDGKSVVTSNFAYDTLGNVLTVTTPGNNAATAITFTFNYTIDGSYTHSAAISRPLTVKDNLGHTTHFRYDAQGNLISQTDALGYATTFAYNLANQRIETNFPYDPTPGVQPTWRTVRTFGYLYPGGPLLTSNNYQTAKDGSGSTLYRRVVYTHGLEGELLSVKGSTEPVTYVYDAAYRLHSLADGNNHPTLYAYNAEGYLQSVTYPNGDTMQYPMYDAIGNAKQRIDGRGITTNFVYNDLENLLTDVQYVDSVQYPNVHLLNVSMTYDDYGRRATMADGAGSTVYGYDDRDINNSRTVTYKDATGQPLPPQTLSYDFYPDGSRHNMTTPAGGFAYGYDAAGRMNDLTNPYGENFGWTYQDNNWLLTQRLGNAAITTYTHAPGYGWLTGLTTLKQDANKTLLSQFNSLQYDPEGNMTTLTASLPAAPQFSGQTNYGYASQTPNLYESRDQLTQEQSTRAGGYNNLFSYDGAGNPTTFRNADPTAGLGYNEANQNKVNQYDGAGNPTTYKGTSFTFDSENRLTSAGNVLTAGYIGNGLRAWKQNVNGRTYFLYDGITPVCELDSAGTIVAVNTFGANGLLARHMTGASAPIAPRSIPRRIGNANAIEEDLHTISPQIPGIQPFILPHPQLHPQSVFYTFDPQGSTAQRLDTSGNILSTHFFDAFGNSATASVDPFGYGSQWSYYTDIETGLQLLGLRYYDTNGGRFINRDPIGFAGGINLYCYVGSAPNRYADPSGTQEILFFGEDSTIIDPSLIDEAMKLNNGRNRVELPDGRKVDLDGKSHPDVDGNPIETPHTHHPKPSNPPPYDKFPPGTKGVPKPSTPEDIQDAINHLRKGCT